jgi:sugar phosphate isomerase/epimerase
MLGSLGSLALALATPRAHSLLLRSTAEAADPSPSKIRLGAQTNAWRIDPRRFDTLLAALSEIQSTGYDGFETGFINLRSQANSLPEARRKIEGTGLTFIGVHIFLPEYDAATNIAPRALYEPVARNGAALGAERLILSGSPAVVPDEIQRKADALNQAGTFAKTLGMTVAYHNHWPEFKYDGKEIEALYAATDASLVSYVLDAGHAFRTGIDLPKFVQRHADRLTGIHFRDYRDGTQVPLGQGKFPLSQVAATLKRADWHGWAMDEEEREDGSKQGLAVIGPAYKALKGAFPA